MKRNTKFIIYALITIFGSTFMLNSCNNDWDDHYNKYDSTSDESLLDKLKDDSDLSTFLGLLEEVGYDTILTYNKAYTVFAPTNEALTSLSENILNNTDSLKLFLGNHICRYSYSSVDSKDDIRVKMLNGKYVEFHQFNGNSYIGNSLLSLTDLSCSNGILHELSSYSSVKANIWSYLNGNSDYSNITDYLAQFDTLTFDELNSTAIGINTLGETVYDSVYSNSNTYFDVIGEVNSEEYNYSFLGLTNNIYQNVYSDLAEYYNYPDEDTVYKYVSDMIVSHLS